MEIEPTISPLSGGKVPVRSWEAAIADLARSQHGVVSRRQLQALGMGPRAIDGRIDRGSLYRLHRGVYKVGYRRINRKGRWMAAVLAAGEKAVLSHRSAARLWRLLPPASERPAVTIPPGRRVKRRELLVHESPLADDEWLIHDGIPVASPFRTIFDLAAVAKMRELERAFHEAEAREMTDRVSLPMLLERHPGRRGSRKLMELLDSRAPVRITRNDFEEAFLMLVLTDGLARPRMNADLAIRGRFIEVDALWEEERLAVELDSRSIHGTRKRLESDRLRDRILVAEGWKTMRFSWRQLQEEPGEIVEDLKAALESPSPTHTHSAR